MLLPLLSAMHSPMAGSVEHVFIPLYIYPNQSWSVVANYSPGVGLVIANPESGPGNSSDPNYASYISMLRQHNITVLGYVPTYYNDGTMPLQYAENEISRYYSWYMVNGIFIDMVPSLCNATNVAYYTKLYDYAKKMDPNGTIMMDPGTQTGSCYAGISDVINIFENNYSVYTKYFTMNNWTTGYVPSHFSMIVYNVPNVTAMRGIIEHAGQAGVGYVFITDRNTNDTLAVLPGYLQQETEYVNPMILHPHFVESKYTGGIVVDFTLAATGGSGNYTYEWQNLSRLCRKNNDSVSCAFSSNSYSISAKVSDSEGFSMYYKLEQNSTVIVRKTPTTRYDIAAVAIMAVALAILIYAISRKAITKRKGNIEKKAAGYG